MKVIKYKEQIVEDHKLQKAEEYIIDILPTLIDKIKESHFNYIAIDADREVYLYQYKPCLDKQRVWNQEEGYECTYIELLPSYCSFNCEESIWKLEEEC